MEVLFKSISFIIKEILELLGTVTNYLISNYLFQIIIGMLFLSIIIGIIFYFISIINNNSSNKTKYSIKEIENQRQRMIHDGFIGAENMSNKEIESIIKAEEDWNNLTDEERNNFANSIDF